MAKLSEVTSRQGSSKPGSSVSPGCAFLFHDEAEYLQHPGLGQY